MIEELWREHQSAQFPRTSRGRDVAGNDLVLLDSTTAGCVSTFVRRGSLDNRRLSMLGLCYHSLAMVTSQLDGEDREYFGRLERLVGLILEAVRDDSGPAQLHVESVDSQ